jgi:hypothetical protein
MRLNLDRKSPYELILAGFGLLLIGIAIISFVLGASFILSSERAEGVVVGYQVSPRVTKQKADPTQAARAPVIEFKTHEGRTVRIVSAYYERDPSHAPGDTVPVLYTPGEPEAGAIDVFSEKWGFPVGFAAVGLLFVLVSRAFRARHA